jgi:hypothetical protein
MHLIAHFERQMRFCETLIALAESSTFQLIQSLDGFPDADISKQYLEFLRQTRDDYQRAIKELQARGA